MVIFLPAPPALKQFLEILFETPLVIIFQQTFKKYICLEVDRFVSVRALVISNNFAFPFFQFDPSKNTAVFARLSYDAHGERLSVVEEVDVQKQRKFYEYIYLHREV